MMIFFIKRVPVVWLASSDQKKIISYDVCLNKAVRRQDRRKTRVEIELQPVLDSLP